LQTQFYGAANSRWCLARFLKYFFSVYLSKIFLFVLTLRGLRDDVEDSIHQSDVPVHQSDVPVHQSDVPYVVSVNFFCFQSLFHSTDDSKRTDEHPPLAQQEDLSEEVSKIRKTPYSKCQLVSWRLRNTDQRLIFWSIAPFDHLHQMSITGLTEVFF
jgi:hypothetical protein